ncbi:GAP family protein [Streptomyces sp. NPDC056121]|nr:MULTISPECIES: GAP family protein [Streptomyces]MCX5079483.1 GAP family protein [Streptomyces sp. NBC_00401]UDL97771.1 GAP family protein [Streptomyces longhuiensis]
MLGNWKDWAAQHNVAVMAVLFFVLGLKLLGDGRHPHLQTQQTFPRGSR